MGEVWRAKDSRLGREVALKVLPEAVATDPDRLSRFEQEARSASALNHPNIVTVYDVGQADSVAYIAMELVEGTSLRDVLAAGALPTKKLLSIAGQIAEGLARAHAAGIVHRDLKPENLMISADGFVKILDFGLAKLISPSIEAVSEMPTAARAETQPGTVLGTVGYMSPEQAMGKALDFRSDQFSLGAILYEMATGVRAFRRGSAPETLAAIIREEPESVADRRTDAPRPLVWIVERCLEKDPEERYASTRDLARDLTQLSEHLSEAGSGLRRADLPPAPRRYRREAIAWTAAAALAVLAAALALLQRQATSGSGRRIQASILPDVSTPEAVTLPGSAATAVPSKSGLDMLAVALSPDATRLAFLAPAPGGRRALWIRPLSASAPAMVAGSEGASYPFWSPDGRWIAFFARGKLLKIETQGGLAQTLCDAPAGRGGSWNPGGDIIFAPSPVGPLSLVSAAGGQPVAATRLDASRREAGHRWPQFLPDGRRYIYFAMVEAAGSPDKDQGLRLGSLDSGQNKFLLPSFSSAVYAPPGYLLYANAEKLLMAQAFDARAGVLRGRPASLSEKIEVVTNRLNLLASASADSTLAYYGDVRPRMTLAWFDRAGQRIGSVGSPDDYGNLNLSPDGKRLAVTVGETSSPSADVWVFDLARGVGTRLTSEPGAKYHPVWSPDGSRIAYGLFEGAAGGKLCVRDANGLGSEEVLAAAPSKPMTLPWDWSRDGRFLAYALIDSRGWSDLWILPLTGDRKVFELLQTRSGEVGSVFSPDSRWLAYASNESGKNEVYVRSYPGAGGKWQISTAGGIRPRWRRDGKEIFYISGDGTLMSVAVNEGVSLDFGLPKPLFKVLVRFGYYDVTADGQRFLVNVRPEQEEIPPITLVLNWAEGLQKP